MIKTYSQRLLPPYYGQVQIAESDRARAVTSDGHTWEIQFLRAGSGGLAHENNNDKSIDHSFRHAATISDSDIRQKNIGHSKESNVDDRILELTDFLADASLPFPAADHFEYWLLDAKDQSPLALIFSAKEPEQMNAYPSRPEWTALPSAVMPIEMTEDEKSFSSAPVNYRFERLVAERASINPKAKWFTRRLNEEESFPNLMVREDWGEEQDHNLCQRYLTRQSPRLLTLHSLDQELRRQLEINARPYALEVERFNRLYPEVVDQVLMNAILVEARLRGVSEDQSEVHNRRDGIHYL